MNIFLPNRKNRNTLISIQYHIFSQMLVKRRRETLEYHISVKERVSMDVESPIPIHSVPDEICDSKGVLSFICDFIKKFALSFGTNFIWG